MTEDEAKKKECLYPARGKCIAAECMAWRVTQANGPQYEHQTLRKRDGEVNPPFSNCPKGWEVVSYGENLFHAQKKTGEEVEGTGYCAKIGRDIA